MATMFFVFKVNSLMPQFHLQHLAGRSATPPIGITMGQRRIGTFDGWYQAKTRKHAPHILALSKG